MFHLLLPTLNSSLIRVRYNFEPLAADHTADGMTLTFPLACTVPQWHPDTVGRGYCADVANRVLTSLCGDMRASITCRPSLKALEATSQRESTPTALATSTIVNPTSKVTTYEEVRTDCD